MFSGRIRRAAIAAVVAVPFAVAAGHATAHADGGSGFTGSSIPDPSWFGVFDPGAPTGYTNGAFGYDPYLQSPDSVFDPSNDAGQTGNYFGMDPYTLQPSSVFDPSNASFSTGGYLGGTDSLGVANNVWDPASSSGETGGAGIWDPGLDQ